MPKIYQYTHTLPHVWVCVCMCVLVMINSHLFIIDVCMLYIKAVRHKQDTIRGQFFSGVHRVWLQFSFSIPSLTKANIQVGWGSRIHSLHLCRGVRPPNECPDMTLIYIWWCGSTLRDLKNMKYPFTAITLRPTLTRNNTAQSAEAVEYTNYISAKE